MLLMHYVSRCTVHRQVFSANLKLSILRVESHQKSGNEFQVIGPIRENARQQNFMSW